MSSRATGRLLTLVLAGLTVLVLALSLPGAARDAFERGGIYLFSREFIEDIPKRLTGPGRFRFILQPVVAILLGIGAGRADRRTGRPPYLQQSGIPSPWIFPCKLPAATTRQSLLDFP